MNEGLDETNLPLILIRKYCRLLGAYYQAYIAGMDVVQADSWIRQHRSHRGFAAQMDDRLEKIYFPNGRPKQAPHHEEIDVIEIAEVPEEPDLDLDDPEMWMQMLIDIDHVGNIVI